MEKLLEEQKKTNELLRQIAEQNKEIIKQNNAQNEMLTVNQVCEEFKIGLNKARKMFNDPELQVQRYTKPFLVSRQALNDYMKVSHDYLREGK